VNKRWLGPLLSIILIIGVGAAIFVSVRGTMLARQKVVVRGLIGSEKEEFFRDERVIRALDRLGIQVDFEKAGSREMAEKLHNAAYDFGFPAGTPAAEKIRKDWKISSPGYDVFFTPMAIASWKPIADLLATNGVARTANGFYTLDMAAFLELVAENKRWNELSGNTAFDASRSILINSTDVTRSNSAAMYLALASYVSNNDSVVQNTVQTNAVLPLMTMLFAKQGMTGYSSEEPFEDYLAMGMGKAPLVMIYEAQYLAEAVRPNGNIRPEMTLIYPDPGIYTKHVLIPLTDNGKKLGEALVTDEELRKLAVEHGLRNNEVAYFNEFVKQHGLQVPDTILNVADTPTFEILEQMIQSIAVRK
jgi:hypothetical protein